MSVGPAALPRRAAGLRGATLGLARGKRARRARARPTAGWPLRPAPAIAFFRKSFSESEEDGREGGARLLGKYEEKKEKKRFTACVGGRQCGLSDLAKVAIGLACALARHEHKIDSSLPVLLQHGNANGVRADALRAKALHAKVVDEAVLTQALYRLKVERIKNKKGKMSTNQSRHQGRVK